MSEWSTSAGAEVRRLLVVVPNHFTALSPTLVNPLVKVLQDGKPTLLVSDSATAELEALRDRAGIPLLLVPQEGLPPLGHFRNDAVNRQNYLLEAELEDDFLSSLPLPGVERAGTTTLYRDRFQWTIATQDVRPFVEKLPWEGVDEVVILGGIGVQTCLASLVVASARGRGLPVLGMIKGPVSGRWAPLWMHGCTELFVGTRERSFELFRLGVNAPAQVEPLLENTLAIQPLELSAEAPQELWVDLDGSSLAQVVRPALESTLAEHPGAVSRLIIPCRDVHERIQRERYGERIAGVPVQYHVGHQLDAALRGEIAVLSCDPYTLYHASELLPQIRLGMMADEVVAMQGGSVPADLRRLIPTPGLEAGA